MSDETAGSGWFAGLDPGDASGAAERIRRGSAAEPADWPAAAVESGTVPDEDAYYDLLHETTVAATRSAVAEAEGADDQQLAHLVRAMDDCNRIANELAERVAEWAGARLGESGSGVGFARRIANRDPGTGDAGADAGEKRLIGLAQRCADLDDEAEALRAEIERSAPQVAPNLSALAGPVLAARLISLAGGLEDLAKSPSSTVQVLGAEDALFAHLRGQGPSPKHGVIFTHDAVRGMPRENRGSAARALAGKLTLAARVDYYSGERKPELDEQLDARIERIRARTDDADSESGGDDQ
ncbi:nucleolar protein-like protein [Salinarchaeum sp. Harcht-Bsk1]|uniref:NOP5/NOP56 family protein n=1 Tax=Salinarchaeum sp. Harcht-Bsk1 TaxID=1333523 RepID=UPI000342302C|nr:NOP5/NOP56 family protein [Salinarchaeum sp. Harcht-Bsk1]AGN02091.1 nucleolar protein-like protein [Salinarchaeum sp. Harcht-Bsk1]